MPASDHLVDWAVSSANETVFYMMNSQECSALRYSSVSNSHTVLNVVWGILFIILGVCTILLNTTAIRGLYSTTDMSKEFFRPAIYVNLSLLDILNGLSAVFSGGVMLSNFTWDDTDGAGRFLCNIFGILFTLSLQTKILLISGGLLITVMTVVTKQSLRGKLALRTAAAVVILSWVLGLVQALMPYFYGSQYTQPDYLTMCIGSFATVEQGQIGNYYAGKLILMFIPFLLGLLICCFTVPGLLAARDVMQVYTWADSYWGAFTMTTLYASYMICHATFYIVHLAGLWVLDNRVLIDFCSLTLTDMRYFFAFMVFTVYLAGIAEPLSYLTANMEVREKLCSFVPLNGERDSLSPANNRITPLLVDIRQHPTSAGSIQKPKEIDV